MGVMYIRMFLLITRYIIVVMLIERHKGHWPVKNSVLLFWW